MFGKLLKHEFRATGRIMLPLLGGVLVLSPLAGLLSKAVNRGTGGGLIRFFSFIFMFAFVVGMVAVFVVSLVIMVRRFYFNMLGDEGYLTFTLPVGVNGLVVSKLVVSFVWFVAAVLIAAIAGAIAIKTYYSGSDFTVVWGFVGDLSELVGAGNIVLYCLEALVMLFLMSCTACLHFYAAMALGNCFSGKKIFLSICFFVLLSIVMGWIQFGILSTIGQNSLLYSINSIYDIWMDGLTEAQAYAAIPHTLFISGSVFFLILSALYYIPTILPLKLKLNLS